MLFKNLLSSWQNWRRFKNLPAELRSVVFFSEGNDYLKYLRPIIDKLINQYGIKVCYITADKNDTLYLEAPENIAVFNISAESLQILFFESLDADILVMTMPDLENFHVKRSRNSVHYAYVHHSIVSTHMIYNSNAFDSFDSILCVGPHHVNEIRQWEKHNNLKPKKLFEHGYAPIDFLFDHMPNKYVPPTEIHKTHVLIAPSWGPNCLLESIGETIIRKLLESGCKVTVRPHPRTARFAPKKMSQLRSMFSQNPKFSMEQTIESLNSLLSADIMISDWSGVALEFAFGLERPVLFIDVPAKINNPRFNQIEAIPIEVTIREKIGVILKPKNIGNITKTLSGLLGKHEVIVKSIRACRSEAVYNIGKSSLSGAEIINTLYKKIKSKH